VHFEFVDVDVVVAFCQRVIALEPAGLIIAGDIAQAPTVERYLRALDRALGMPIYFVLGNHDFYRGGIAEVRTAVSAVVERSEHLHWLSNIDYVSLTPETAIVGHDGWADARAGDYDTSPVMLNDYKLIAELSGLSHAERRQVLERLGDESASHFRRVLPLAFEQHRRVLAVTHVPPFPEASWYQGRISGPDWLPHFTSVAAGDAMVEAMAARPDRELIVLAGHTHSGGSVRIRPNLEVRVGSAAYGSPDLQEMLPID